MIFVKPNGTEIEINDHPETIEYCKSLGWKEKKARQRKAEKAKEESTD